MQFFTKARRHHKESCRRGGSAIAHTTNLRLFPPVIGLELPSSPSTAEPPNASGAQAGDVRLSGSMTLSRPAPGVRFRAVAITALGSLSWKAEGSWSTKEGAMIMIFVTGLSRSRPLLGRSHFGGNRNRARTLCILWFFEAALIVAI